MPEADHGCPENAAGLRNARKRGGRKKIVLIAAAVLVIAAVVLTVHFTSPQKKYGDADFQIETYHSGVDRDGDGVDDQADILRGAKDYIATKPVYRSEYYASGYPDDGCGVCTDVVAFSLRSAGYDLMELVDADIREAPGCYDVEVPDKNIDFRRVRNLKVYFERNSISLTTDIHRISEWQGGDIVVFPDHIGIVSDRRNADGVPFVLHHANEWQRSYEENILAGMEITGHFRVS